MEATLAALWLASGEWLLIALPSTEREIALPLRMRKFERELPVEDWQQVVKVCFLTYGLSEIDLVDVCCRRDLEWQSGSAASASPLSINNFFSNVSVSGSRLPNALHPPAM